MAPIATIDLTEPNPSNVGATKKWDKGSGGLQSPMQAVDSTIKVWQLDRADIDEIEMALKIFEDSGLDLSKLCPETFPLPKLCLRLDNAKDFLCNGDGYVLVRGLRPNDYSPYQNVVIFAGLTSYVGRKRAMVGYADGSKSVMQHITEVPISQERTLHHLANQTKMIPMHTDKGDIVALYTLSRSLEGGRFYLADIQNVFNEMVLTRPDLATVLIDDWVQMDPSSNEGSVTRPLLFPIHGNAGVMANFSRAFITGTPGRPRPTSLPPITPQQEAALEELQRIAMHQATAIDFRPGNLLLFNNLRLMHSRDAFVDDRAAGRKRHLLRLILQAPKAWKMEAPPELRDTWEGLFNHTGDEELFDIKPELFTFSMGP